MRIDRKLREVNKFVQIISLCCSKFKDVPSVLFVSKFPM